MALKDLYKTSIMQQHQQDREREQRNEDSPEMRQLINKCRGLQFYRWWGFTSRTMTRKKHDSLQFITWKPSGLNGYKSSCCFNHVIGLPVKGGKTHPMYDYERMLFDALEIPSYLNSTNIHNKQPAEVLHPQKVGHLLLLKSTGIGATEFFTRYIVWKCLVNDDLKDSDICIITGPREQLSIDIINRIRQLFSPFNITFDTKETTLFLNGVRIRSYPSNRLQDMRGLANVSIICCDEAAFFDKNSQSEVIDVCERYAGKSRAKIILCSTPNKVGDLVHTLLQQPYDKSFYKVVKLDYTYSLGKLYSEDDIRVAKASQSFEREYNLSFSSSTGDCFSQSSIDRAVELGDKYPITINKMAQHSAGCDPGFGSSSFGICVLEHSDEIIKVVYADQFERSSFNDMIQKVWELHTTIGLDNIYCDGANVEFIEAIKQELGENSDWHYIHDKISWAKKNNLDIASYMRVVPVSFAQEGPSMLVHCKNLLENEDSLVAINSKWDKLITGLRGAVAVEYKLNKNETPYPDLVDAYRLAMKYFKLRK